MIDLFDVRMSLELLAIRDQTAFTFFETLQQAYQHVITKNTKYLLKIIDKTGFISPSSKFGKKAAHYMYLLILHSHHNKSLQKEYLKWLKSLPKAEQKILDVYNFEYQVTKNPYKPNNLDTKPPVPLKLIETVPYDPDLNFRVGYTTRLLGNLSYKYDKPDIVLKRSKLYLELIQKAPDEEVLINLESKDKLIIANKVIPQIRDLSFYDNGNNLREKGLEADAIIMDIPNKSLSILVGDCYVIFFFDPVTKIYGAMHVGNPGYSLDLPAKTLNILREKFDIPPNRVHIYMSPGIKPFGYIYENIDKFKNNPLWKGFIYNTQEKLDKQPLYNQIANLEFVDLLAVNNSNFAPVYYLKYDPLPLELLEKVATTKYSLTKQDVHYGVKLDLTQKPLPRSGYRLNLYSALIKRLLDLGIKYDNIHASLRDTLYNQNLYSHYGSYHLNYPDGRFIVHGEVVK